MMVPGGSAGSWLNTHSDANKPVRNRIPAARSRRQRALGCGVERRRDRARSAMRGLRVLDTVRDVSLESPRRAHPVFSADAPVPLAEKYASDLPDAGNRTLQSAE